VLTLTDFTKLKSMPSVFGTTMMQYDSGESGAREEECTWCLDYSTLDNSARASDRLMREARSFVLPSAYSR
jgi:hypothetical protein